MSELTSAELKAELLRQTQNLPSSNEEDESTISTYAEHGLGADIPVEEDEGELEGVEVSEEEILAQPYDDPSMEYIRRESEKIRAKRQERQQWESMTAEEQLQYFKSSGYVPLKENSSQPSTQEEQGQMVLNALETDFLELGQRYGEGLVKKFMDDFKLSKVKIPRGQEKIDNALEDLFFNWVQKNGAMDKMSASEIRVFLKATEGPPLICRSRDLVMPEHKKPEKPKKPRKPREESTFRFPEITTDDFNEMINDWSKKHPERWRR